ncbi:MAG: DUF2782 domain-containing protein [Rhodocyclaceae bacterium]|nr:DUF2782 domain-containing protein [Rhodocyclaceae bacterium]
MRLSCQLIAIALGVWAAFPAAAQTRPPALEPLPEPPPPPPGFFDAPDAPQVTIKKRGEDKIEEYRLHGKLYMIKVTPAHGVPYYLVDLKGDGVFVREEAPDGGPRLSVPMWVIHQF